MVLRGGCMNEKSLTVLEQYEINLKEIFRTKGNYGCVTEKDIYILQEYSTRYKNTQHKVQKYPTLEKSTISENGNFFAIFILIISIFGNNAYICQNKI